MAPEGTPKIKRHPDGTRYCQPYLGTNRATGKPMRPYRSFPNDMTDEQVAEAARTWYAEISAGLKVGTTIYLRDLLTEYVNRREVEGAAANSVKTWRMYVRNYLGKLGRRDPRRIKTSDISDLYYDLQKKKKNGDRALSHSTVLAFHWFLCKAWDWMINMGVCESNPVRPTPKPHPEKHDAKYLKESEFVDLVIALDTELEAEPTDAAGIGRRVDAFAAWFALSTGMRCGEVCAVRRRDIDNLYNEDKPTTVRVNATVIEANGIRRQETPKSKKTRSVTLTEGDAATIRHHIEWQDEVLGKGSRSRTLVSADGGLRAPSTVSRGFTALARKYDLEPGVTFHTLRHTHATMLLTNGIDVREVADRLGHEDAALTLRFYAHVMEGRDGEAAAAAAEVTEAARRKRGGRA